MITTDQRKGVVDVWRDGVGVELKDNEQTQQWPLQPIDNFEQIQPLLALQPCCVKFY
jgi:hypothetical protein